MKRSDWYIIIVVQTIITILVLLCERWLCVNPLGSVNMVDALTIWATVITLVFLVFSVMGLMNIERKTDEVEKSRLMQEQKFKEIEEKTITLVQSIEQVKKEIVEKSQEQIKKIVNGSTERINFFDRLVAIQRDPMPDRQIMNYTNLLQETKEIEGIDMAYIYINRGYAYMFLKKMREAFGDFETAIKVCQNVNKESAYSSMAYYYVVVGDYEKSIEYYSKALEVNPQSAPLCMDMGNSLNKLGKFDEAESYFMKALSYNPEMAEIYYNKAVRLKDMEGISEKEQMLAYLNKCIEINPAFIKAYINKAAIYRENKKDKEAIDILNQVISPVYNEDFLMAVEQRGIAYRLTKQFPQALNDFNFVLLFSPDNIQNLSNLAMTHLMMGQFNEAIHYGELGLKQANVQNSHFCNADLESVVNEAKSALKHWEKTVDYIASKN